MPSFTFHVLLESDAVFKVRASLVTNNVDTSSVLDEHTLVYPAAQVFSGAIVTSCSAEGSGFFGHHGRVALFSVCCLQTWWGLSETLFLC